MNWHHYLFMFGLLLLSNILLYKRVGLWISPYSIMSVSFFTPMLLATTRVSYLQSSEWHEDTVLLLIISFFVWGLYPFFSTWIRGKQSNYENINNRWLSKISPCVIRIILALALLNILAYLLENYLLASSFIPILLSGPEAHLMHTKSLFGLHNISHASSPIALLLFMVYASNRKKYFLLILFIVVFIPFTRGSRSEIYITLIGLFVMNYHLNVFVLSRYKVIFGVIPAVFIIAILFNAIGVIRSTQGEMDDYVYSKSIQVNIEADYFDAVAWYYGYFALPFENLDRLIRKNPSKRLWGMFSIMPLTAPFINLKHISDDFPDMDTVNNYGDPVTSTGVPTSLAFFYMDFGMLGAFFPMFVYMFLWLFLFHNRNRYHISVLAIYSLYSGFFSLAAFQATMLAPELYRRIFLIAIPFILVKMLPRISHRFQ